MEAQVLVVADSSNELQCFFRGGTCVDVTQMNDSGDVLGRMGLWQG